MAKWQSGKLSCGQSNQSEILMENTDKSFIKNRSCFITI